MRCKIGNEQDALPCGKSQRWPHHQPRKEEKNLTEKRQHHVNRAFVVLAAGDTHESVGRVVNALMGALEYIESDGEITIIFDGAGTQAAAAFAKSEHKYNELFERVRPCITGVCSYCAGAYGVKDQIEACQLPLMEEFKGHPTFRQLLENASIVFTFWDSEGQG